jgi:hypothetical protein
MLLPHGSMHAALHLGLRKLEDLRARVQRGAYRAQPSRRVCIPKPDGRQRPLAVAALEDKIVQRATATLLNALLTRRTSSGSRMASRLGAGRMRSPRFRRDPFVRDGVFDHGRATAPRIPGPQMSPSTFPTVSASASSIVSRLNSPPHTIVVYASRPPSPTTPQHSQPGARHGLPGPDLHRLDHASLPGARELVHAYQGIKKISLFR